MVDAATETQLGGGALQQGVDEEQLGTVAIDGPDPVRGERVEVRTVTGSEIVHGVPERHSKVTDEHIQPLLAGMDTHEIALYAVRNPHAERLHRPA